MSVWAVVLLGFFDSIMFPTIFALSIKNLGAYTKLGSSLLVMSIIGGAIVPAVMGYISDRSSIQAAFAVPLLLLRGRDVFFIQWLKPAPAGPERRSRSNEDHNMARMKFLVTGGLGFIGQSVVRNLLDRGIPTVAADQSADAEALATLHRSGPPHRRRVLMLLPWTSAISAT